MVRGKVINMEKIEWCVSPLPFDEHQFKCCICNHKTVYSQVGDGKFLHSLCNQCYWDGPERGSDKNDDK